jgi:Fe-S-cluster containining protein
MSTGEFIAQHTHEGVLLQRHEDQPGHPCVFLGPAGCTVHADRPYVCRVYPLGRTVLGNGTELYGELDPHPQTEGEYGTSGTVEDYLRTQNTADFEAALHQYQEFYKEFGAALDSAGEAVADDGDEDFHVMDVDAWITDYCARHGLPEPTAPDAKVPVHLAALREWITKLT